MKKAIVQTGYSVRVGSERHTEGDSIGVPKEEHESFVKLAEKGIVKYDGVQKINESYKEQELDVDDDELLGKTNKALEEANETLKKANEALQTKNDSLASDVAELKNQVAGLLEAGKDGGNTNPPSNQELLKACKTKDEVTTLLVELSDDEVAELESNIVWVKPMLEERLNGNQK